jgi:hypothetical protein
MKKICPILNSERKLLHQIIKKLERNTFCAISIILKTPASSKF